MNSLGRAGRTMCYFRLLCSFLLPPCPFTSSKWGHLCQCNQKYTRTLCKFISCQQQYTSTRFTSPASLPINYTFQCSSTFKFIFAHNVSHNQMAKVPLYLVSSAVSAIFETDLILKSQCCECYMYHLYSLFSFRPMARTILLAIKLFPSNLVNVPISFCFSKLCKAQWSDPKCPYRCFVLYTLWWARCYRTLEKWLLLRLDFHRIHVKN